MTGEISISGKVLPIGGLREKTMAAYKAGIANIIIPKENERDLAEIDLAVKDGISFYPVTTIEEVIALATVPQKTAVAKETPAVRKPKKRAEQRPGAVQ